MKRRWMWTALAVAGLWSCAASTPVPQMTTSARPLAEARGLPADGKILFILGQDTDTLGKFKYELLNGDVPFPAPGGVTLYTSPSGVEDGSGPPPLAGMFGPTTLEGVAVDFERTLNDFPGAALAVGLHLSDSFAAGQEHCANLPLRAIAGDADEADVTRYRAQIDRMLRRFIEWNRTVYLRIGYEFDGIWNCYRAQPYQAAFRYIRRRIDELGAARVATVWQTAAWPLDEHGDHPEWNYTVSDPDHLSKWYPGDDVVDWVGVSHFVGAHHDAVQWNCDPPREEHRDPSVAPRALQDRVLEFARAHRKPVMVAESAPQGFDLEGLTASCVWHNRPAKVTAPRIWEVWFQDFFAWIEQNQDVIRAVAYINTDWQSQPMWQCDEDGCPNGYWGNTALQANAEIMRRFAAELDPKRWATR